MSQFIIVLSGKNQNLEAQNIYGKIHKYCREFRFPPAIYSIVEDDLFLKIFPRLNQTGSNVVYDKRTGSWLFSVGTWFHSNGQSVGYEKELLENVLVNGLDRVARDLDGFFNIIFYDGSNGTLNIITDIIGSCFCFYRIINNRFVISSSSLLLAYLEEVSLDVQACQEFLTTGIIYGNKTYYKEVRRLKAACITSIFRDRKTEKVYWPLGDVDEVFVKGEEAVSLFKEELVLGCRKVSKVFGDQVCDLTAGLDSRVLLSGYLLEGQKFDTVVVGKDDSPDVVISQELAILAGLKHHHLCPEYEYSDDKLREILSLTDGEFNLFEYLPIAHVHERLSQEYDVGINGSFGEVARGYWWELLFPNAGKPEKLDSLMLSQKRFAIGDHIDFFPGYTHRQLVEDLAAEIDFVLEGIQQRPNTLQMDSCYLNMRMRCWQGRIASSTNKIWPCFSPLIFKSMLELLLRVDPKLRTGDQLYKKFLKKYNPLWGNHRTEYGIPAVPISTSNFFKFWPVPLNIVRKIYGRGARMVGLSPKGNLSRQQFAMRKNIMTNKLFCDVSSADSMCVAEAMDKNVLRSFLDSANEPDFTKHTLWERLVSLELTIGASRSSTAG